jgi:group I intron endonuclease
LNVYRIKFPNAKLYFGVEGKAHQRKWAHSRAKNNRSKTLVSHAIRKYGWKNCKFDYVVMGKNPEFCYQLEIKLIKNFKTQDSNFGYNQSSGGERGFSGVKMSQDHKAKIGKAHKGKKVKKSTGKLISKRLKGRFLTEKHKANISKGLTGKTSGMKNKKHSSKTKNKISNSIKGKKNPFYGKTHSPETIAKIIASNKRRAKNV